MEENIKDTKGVMLIVIGDIHGQFEKLTHYISEYDLRDCVLIQAGDFGAGFKTLRKEKASMKYINSCLVARNIVLYAIRGNHDNPKMFNEKTLDTSNIFLMKDYSTIILGDGRKILCVGGAISVDRLPNPIARDEYGKPWKGRTEGKNYWKDEPFVLNEEKLEAMRDVDIVISHSAPNFVYPFGCKGSGTWINNDPTLYTELMDERENIAKMYEILKKNNNPISHFLYGHFHNSNKEEKDGTVFKLLDIFEFYEVK
jgi:predicted phosphodiesterase